MTALATSGAEHVIITITGTDDSPVFCGVSATDAYVARKRRRLEPGSGSDHGTLAVSDKDVGDTATASGGCSSASVSGGGTAPAAVVTALTYGALSFGSVISDGGTRGFALDL